MMADFRALQAAAAALIAFLAAGCGAGEAAPPPPRRPPEPEPAAPKSAPSPHSPGAAEQERLAAGEMDACVARLASLGVEFQTVAVTAENPACAVAMPIQLKRIVLRGDAARPIEFPARPLVDCRLAEPLALWLEGAVGPILAAGFSSRLTAVRTGAGYECRNRNRAAAGKISAHAVGLALDISGFELADGRTVPAVSPKDEPASALNSLRTAACGWFTTVLGPGSDPMHEDHLHVDIEPHGASGRYRICE
jgi:hypothetical protein